MGLADNLKNVAGNLQQGAKNASVSLAQRLLRATTGLFIGAILSLIIQEFTKNGVLVAIFLTILFMSIIYRLLRSMTIFQIFIFDVICILIATLLRMYIMIAP